MLIKRKLKAGLERERIVLSDEQIKAFKKAIKIAYHTKNNRLAAISDEFEKFANKATTSNEIKDFFDIMISIVRKVDKSDVSKTVVDFLIFEGFIKFKDEPDYPKNISLCSEYLDRDDSVAPYMNLKRKSINIYKSAIHFLH